MRVFALADSHLSFLCDKPMDKFEKIWKDHPTKIATNVNSYLQDGDVLLLPGDISWAINMSEAEADLKFLNELHGRKILLRGNHDYWWSTPSKLRRFFDEKDFNKLEILQCDGKVIVDDKNARLWAISGSRFWNMPHEQKTEKDKMIYARELKRADLSLADVERQLKVLTNSKNPSGINIYNEYKVTRVFMSHFPLIDALEKHTEALDLLKKYNIDICIYGHLHAYSHKLIVEGEYEGISFYCVAADYRNFVPLELE